MLGLHPVWIPPYEKDGVSGVAFEQAEGILPAAPNHLDGPSVTYRARHLKYVFFHVLQVGWKKRDQCKFKAGKLLLNGNKAELLRWRNGLVCVRVFGSKMLFSVCIARIFILIHCWEFNCKSFIEKSHPACNKISKATIMMIIIMIIIVIMNDFE